MSELQDVLQERGSVHGDFKTMSIRIKGIQQSLKGMSYEKLPSYQQHALDLIAVKLGRILEGDNDFDDHWRDIAGYATRVMEELPMGQVAGVVEK